jgi:hypothetical protein
MKRILLFLFILLSLSEVKASDTLTIRQVFNFNVGDTFDYRSTLTNNPGEGPIYYGQTYSRYIISAKTLSAGSDTVTYIRHQVYPLDRFDTLVYTNLDSSVFVFFGSPSVSHLTYFDPDGRLIDSLYVYNSAGPDYSGEYGTGLGLTYSSYKTFGNGSSVVTDTTLIYYAKDTDTWGTTYYQYIGPNVPHYTPIPEDSAYWNYIYQCPWYADGAIFPYFGAPVSTGGKINFNGHTYVDIGLGYFRNDTVGQKVYFMQDTSSPEVLLYDFTLRTSDSALGNNFLNLNTITINGGTRIVWEDPSGLDYIEGIGSIYGFPGMGYEYTQYYSIEDATYAICQATPVLQSFCAGGQTLYSSNGAYGKCFPLAIANINSNPQIHLYPNPTSDQLHLSISDMNGPNYQLILTDILGQEVYSSPVTQSESIHDISGLSSGMYMWRVGPQIPEGGFNTNRLSIIKTGKVIKQ